MGIFDAFKKKVEEVSKLENPLHGYLKRGDLAIENLQVVDANGTVTLTGTAQDGEAAAKAVEMLKAKGVASITNNISIADLSHLGIRYKVKTESSNLNCRKGPSTDAEIVGKFPKDAVVTLLQKHNAAWYKVRGSEAEGYCNTDYLEQVSNT
jgi:uncharacterized protein YgiM (DUF1202 family)